MSYFGHFSYWSKISWNTKWNFTLPVKIEERVWRRYYRSMVFTVDEFISNKKLLTDFVNHVRHGDHSHVHCSSRHVSEIVFSVRKFWFQGDIIHHYQFSSVFYPSTNSVFEKWELKLSSCARCWFKFSEPAKTAELAEADILDGLQNFLGSPEQIWFCLYFTSIYSS